MSHSLSVQSNHSLCSQGPTDISNVEKSNPRKVPAKWTEGEEHVLVLFLQEHTPAAGNGLSFSKKHFNNVCQHLKEKFLNQHSGEKTSSTCLSKWTSLKEEYFAVINLKKASGFIWSDEHGAGMSSHDAVWKDYVKVWYYNICNTLVQMHRCAACFQRNKGFHLFTVMAEMMPLHSKGMYVFHLGSNNSSTHPPSVPPLHLQHCKVQYLLLPSQSLHPLHLLHHCHAPKVFGGMSMDPKAE
ncbi:hypothetical protein PISMIDRAFT_111880 [Pisolithus microcarpus 441]|uniref:Myb/SANT-like domain-containing protein n=1 Tax=Pisolithus microcarpus 441 TaxID=765257 RepID=A0A0C9ZBA6_9AGAM|nr:hypothetical protein BKA83DRAFT_111880 [Pisolithus microcarpus]KIK17203.1 hypothetical protein PISMIDRAFT_111880 [Pisolithus microcarpus 441]